MASKFEWEPNVRVGAIRFGDPIAPLVEQGGFREIETDHATASKFGNEADGLFFLNSTDEEFGDPDSVQTIICDKSLLYEGRELLGLSIDGVVDILGQQPQEVDVNYSGDSDGWFDVARFDRVGLHLWLLEGVSAFAVLSDDSDLDEDDLNDPDLSFMPGHHEWWPADSYGRIRFRAPCQRYVDAGWLEPVTDEDGVVFYRDVEGDATIYAEQAGDPPRDVVDAIECATSLLYRRNSELFGLRLEEVNAILEAEPDEVAAETERADEFDARAVYNGLGLMLWLKDGVAVFASLDEGD